MHDNIKFNKYSETLTKTLNSLAVTAQSSYETDKVHDWNVARLKLLKNANVTPSRVTPSRRPMTAPPEKRATPTMGTPLATMKPPRPSTGGPTGPTSTRPRSAIKLHKYTTARPSSAQASKRPKSAHASSHSQMPNGPGEPRPRPSSALPGRASSTNLNDPTSTHTHRTSSASNLHSSTLHSRARHTIKAVRSTPHGTTETLANVSIQNDILSQIDEERDDKLTRAMAQKLVAIRRKDRRFRITLSQEHHDTAVKLMNKDSAGPKQFFEAADLLTDAMSFDAEAHHYHVLRGNCWKSLNMYDRAWADVSQAIFKEAKEHSLWYASRAAVLLHMKRIPEAELDLDKACEIGHDNPHHFYNRAIIRSEHARPPDNSAALADLTRAIRIIEHKLKSTMKKTDLAMTLGESPISYKFLHQASAELHADAKFVFKLRVHRGDVQFRMRHFEEAIKDLSEAVCLDVASHHAWYLLGLTHAASASPLEAEKCLTNAVEIDPDQPEYFFERGNARLLILEHADAGDAESTFTYGDVLQKATDDFNVAISLQNEIEEEYEPNTPTTDKDLLAPGQSPIAAEFLQQLKVRGATYHNGLCRAYLMNGSAKFYAMALVEVEVTLTIDPNNHLFLHQAGLAYLALQDDKMAEAMFQKVLVLEPSYCPSLYYLAKTFLDDIELEPAAATLTRCISLKCEGVAPWDVYHLRGLVFFQENFMARACDDFSQAIALEDASPLLNRSREKNFFYRGETKRCSGDFVGALADYAIVENLSPKTINTAPYRFARGVCLAEMNDLEGGLGDLTVAVEMDATNTSYMSRRADVLARLGLFAQAEQLLDRGVEISQKKKDKNLWVLLKKLANSQFAQKNFKQASNQFQIALMNTKADIGRGELTDLHYKRGICLAHMKKYRSASSSFDKALEVLKSVMGSSSADSKKILLHHERAKSNQMLKKHQDAIDDFSIVIKMSPEDDRAVFRRGWSYKSLGLFLLAAEDFERAKELNSMCSLYELNYRNIGDIETIVLCPAGEERTPDHLRDLFQEELDRAAGL